MRLIVTTLAAGLFLLVHMLLLASSAPVIRYAHYAPAHWPAGASTQRLVLLTDSHVSGPDAPPARLVRIVQTINRLRPDVVLLGGDFASTKKLVTRRYSVADAIRPFASLRASSGIVAVLGNHDHWSDPVDVRQNLMRAGVTVLDNDAVRLGNFVFGGVDDDFTGRANVRLVAERMRRLGGTPIMLSHSPDIFPDMPAWIGLALAGHTHCSQIRLPLIGALYTASRYGRRFACGAIHERNQWMIVSAGVGTSLLPLRLGAAPDIWVIDVGR